MVKVNIGCLNCRGLSSDNIKRRDIFMKCRENYDITFLVDTHCKKELEPYWHSEWGYKMFFSSHTTNSRGVAILFKNTFACDIIGQKSDTQGNYLILDLKICELRITMAVIYGPNNDEPSFYETFQKDLENFGNTSILVGGDWNLPQNYTLDTMNYLHKNNQKAQEKVHNMMSELDLIDIFRELYPDKRRFSWRGPNKKQARLDYFLTTSDFQPIISECDIGVAYRSDHSPVSLTLQFNASERGKGTWKFNNALLYDKDYINIVKTCIGECIDQYKTTQSEIFEEIQFSISDQLFWETLKMMIRGRTISYSSYKKKERCRREEDLESKLRDLYKSENSEQNHENILKIELELKILREAKAKGAMMRAKARWQIEGERSTKYFCNLEKRNYTEKLIPNLILDTGENVEDQAKIRAEQKIYYEKLYKSQNTNINDVHKQNFFLIENPFIRVLSEEKKK